MSFWCDRCGEHIEQWCEEDKQYHEYNHIAEDIEKYINAHSPILKWSVDRATFWQTPRPRFMLLDAFLLRSYVHIEGKVLRVNIEVSKLSWTMLGNDIIAEVCRRTGGVITQALFYPGDFDGWGAYTGYLDYDYLGEEDDAQEQADAAGEDGEAGTGSE